MRLGETGYLALAALLHGVLPVAAAMAPQVERTRWVQGAPVEVSEIDIDLSAVPDDFVRPPDYDGPLGMPRYAPLTNLTPTPTSPYVPRQPPPAASEAGDEPPAPEHGPEEPTGPPSTLPDEYGKPPAGPAGAPWGTDNPLIPHGLPPSMLIDPLAPDKTRSTARTTTPTRRAPEEGIAHKVVQRAMRSHDNKMSLSLPAASKIASVLSEAVRGSHAPNQCQGSFSVTISGAGKVISVSLLSYSGGGAGVWQGVRQAAMAQLAGDTFVMRADYANGAIVSVHVKSSEAMPSGEGSFKGVSGTFDVSNAGAKPTRKVTAGFGVQAIE